ncbi:MAG: nasD, partial [Paenibacillus sp.]|nr:nasD [Paenibacillus sp.]
TEEIMGRSRAIGLRFKDGTRTDADLVVMAVGVRPNVQLAKDSLIETNRAIVVNDYMQTNIPHVYAVGECAEHRGFVYGLVAPLYEQGKVLAHHICGIDSEGYQGTVLATQLKVSGVDVFSAGEFMDTDDTKSLKMYDGIRNIYKKVTVRDNKIVGAVLFGDISESTKLLGMIKQQADISVWEKELYGSRSSGQETGEALIASMSDKELVCACNGVSKGTIVQAIQEQGLQSLDEIKKCTKASSSCGSCKPLVNAILEYTQSHGFEHAVEKETVCGCTTLSHDEVVVEIQNRHFANAKAVMSVLGWSHPDGCAKCRPALHYYLGIHGSAVKADSPYLLEENETADRNILADGTYAVTPRIYGGVTSARQLRQIADVVEKYRVPVVKLSSGLRLDLLGIKKEDVPSVSAELDKPEFGPLYGAMLGTVGTCTGASYARDAMQDSIRMGITVEKKLERLQTPFEVTISVSASPHYDAGTLTKDFGIVGTPGGWELYIGGNGTSHVRQGQLLCTSASDEELLTFLLAALQYYRETARYAERTWTWVERMGLVQVREALFNQELQQALVERLEAALSIAPSQVDQQPSVAVIR